MMMGAVVSTTAVMFGGAKGERSQALIPDKLCRAHLEKVLSSATFARAEQLRRLLEWLGERSLMPGAAPPTEKEIGETVLRRSDFDPQADSLVRKEMSRLREKLKQYYGKEGDRDRVCIRHLGGYRLGFAWADHLMTETHAATGLPCLLVLPLRSHPDLNPQCIRLAEELSILLGEAGGTALVSPTTAMSYAGRIGDVREFAAECDADFVLEGSLDLSDMNLRATLWLVNGRNGKTERSGRFIAPDPDQLARLAALWLHEQMLRLRVN